MPQSERHGWARQGPQAPGPITLDVNFPDHSSHQTKVIIPKGLGGLMLEVKQGVDGDLELGYF